MRANVTRFRGQAGMTLRDLSARLEELGRPLSHATISEIERGARRVDVDDLTTLAVALGVSPAALLMPPATDPIDDMIELSGIKLEHAGTVWNWLTAQDPLDASFVPEQRDEFEIEQWRRRTTPPWNWATLRRVEG